MIYRVVAVDADGAPQEIMECKSLKRTFQFWRSMLRTYHTAFLCTRLDED